VVEAGAAVATDVAPTGLEGSAPEFVAKAGPPAGKRRDERLAMSVGENPCDVKTAACAFEPLDARGAFGVLGALGATVGQREKAKTKNMTQLTARLMRNAVHKMPMDEMPRKPYEPPKARVWSSRYRSTMHATNSAKGVSGRMTHTQG
jgi:hypothetical protein